jgi:hypothetical protein
MMQPRISRLSIWERHEKRVIEILLIALSKLQNRISLAQSKAEYKSEVDLNRELYFCLLEANQVRWEIGEGFDHPPIGEGKNPPNPDDEQRAVREDKIPDFLWGFIDHTELDPKRSAHYFVIECKRLGKPPRSDWVLNTNYVQNGIRRFITEEHAYAKGEQSGAMVGYIQSMELDEILNEVSNAASIASIPILTIPIKTWNEQAITMLEHSLTRPFSPSTFSLKHYWVDLRTCYITASTQYSPNNSIQQAIDTSTSV